jgi:PAS domain S-box-containing protein
MDPPSLPSSGPSSSGPPSSGSAGPGRPESASPPAFRELSRTFWRGVSTTQGLGVAIADVLRVFNADLGARRSSVWLHDRRARELLLLASSDHAYAAAGPAGHRVAVGDAEQAAARGLRLDRPQLLGGPPEPSIPAEPSIRAEPSVPAEPLIIVPLRGWRRALGTLVIEGVGSTGPSDEQRLDLAGDLGRQLSAGIENVQLLEDMLRQRRLLEDTFNSLIDLVVVTDGRQRVVQMNDAFARRLGRSRAELFERPLVELVGADLSDWAAASEADLTSARVRTLEHPDLGGQFVVTMTPLINEDGESVGTVLVARDVTRQTRLEAEREALRAKLAQSEKLASLGQFVAGIAHEINNPLQGVLGHLELLLVGDAGPGTSPVLRRELRRVYREADRAAKIVQNLLTFSGAQRKVRRRLRIERVVSRAVASRRRSLARARIDLVCDHQEETGPVFVLGDPFLLQQAFLNVLINAEHAIAATGDAGSIVISTKSRDGRVITTIRDSGGGIAEEVLPRLFDPFFTTKSVGQGTGLGLAITYGIVQEHGGTIHAASDGRGAVFTIELPGAETG